MRELYVNPEMEVVEFDAKDVITTSGVDCPMDGMWGCGNEDVDPECPDDGWIWEPEV